MEYGYFSARMFVAVVVAATILPTASGNIHPACTGYEVSTDPPFWSHTLRFPAPPINRYLGMKFCGTQSPPERSTSSHCVDGAVG
jgi:hypothetical protein